MAVAEAGSENYLKASFAGSINVINPQDTELVSANLTIPNSGWVSVGNGSFSFDKETCTTVGIPI